MDVGGSFLELSCVRIALIPVGAAMPDHRFEELTSHLTAFREIPVSALPRRTSAPRSVGNPSFSTMPSAIREAFSDASAPSPLHRSRSASKDIGHAVSRSSLPSLKSHADHLKDIQSNLSMQPLGTHSGNDSAFIVKKVHTVPASPTNTADLDLTGPEVDSSFRLRYDVIHRDHAGALIMKPFSEWDDFHSSKTLGVFGLVDCTSPLLCENAEKRKLAIFDAYDDFSAALNNFKDASVRRLIVFTTQNAAQESGAFVLNDPKSPSHGNGNSSLHFSVGYVPERSKIEGTRLEVRAQIIHFAGLLLNAIDRDCWKRRESPSSELFLSPIDEKYSADRQSKLAKRRAGRLEKILADSLLLMGNPAEAILKYNSAIEKAKANSDRLWLAGAMEGWSAAHVLTHIGAGGSVNDQALSDRLIEHYNEIYKLYQKKRVAEPEAAAALRLAEFLGRWTNRRKDALEAAEHAATVGKGLRTQKLAALWEALARFSERMGCRRKAALFLYRLGHLNASQSVWSSAVALMIAAERQLTRNGTKPWAELNRKVLLNAAGHAEEAGDSHMAARLYVEALVMPQNPTGRREEDDTELIKLLSKAQVPPHLPAAQKVVHLVELCAIQSPSLSLRHRLDDDETPNPETQVRDGPFIYNPFEAKKRAREAAVARKNVTWVCGEPAQVSVRLNNNLSAEVSIEIVSVLFSVESGKEEKGSSVERNENYGKDILNAESVDQDENDASVHTEYIRALLKQSNKLAKTVNETLTLAPSTRKSGVLKHISIVPKRTGPLYVRGLLVQLFHGALVVLRASGKNVGPVTVIKSLPRVTLSTHIMDGVTMERNSSRTPLTVYSGEKRRFRVDIENNGTEPISWMKGNVHSNRSEVLEVVGHDLGRPDIAVGLESHGSSRSFVIEVLGKHPDDYCGIDSDEGEDSFSTYQPFSVVSITVEYEGKHSMGTIRESGLYVKIASMPAVIVSRADLLDDNQVLCGNDFDNEPLVQSIALEVRNMVAAPATVEVHSLSEVFNTARRDTKSMIGEGDPLSLDDCLVESGASARLTGLLSSSIMSNILLASFAECSDEEVERKKQAVLRVKWKLPALGREGHWEITNLELWKMLFERASQQQSEIHMPMRYACTRRQLAGAMISFSFEGPGIQKAAEAGVNNGVTVTEVGLFWKVTIQIANNSTTSLPSTLSLDVEIFGDNDRAITQDMNFGLIVGATEMVEVGPLLAQTGVFEHSVQVRILSTGTFKLQACVYDASRDAPQQEKLPDHPNESHDVRDDMSSQRQTLIDGDDNDARSETIPVIERYEHGPSTSLSSVNMTSEALHNVNAVETSHAFKRTGMTKRRKSWTKSDVDSGILQPKTVDSYPDVERQRVHSEVLACADVLISVVDGTPTTIRRRDMTSAQSLTSMPMTHMDNTPELPNTNLDTIYA